MEVYTLTEIAMLIERLGDQIRKIKTLYPDAAVTEIRDQFSKEPREQHIEQMAARFEPDVESLSAGELTGSLFVRGGTSTRHRHSTAVEIRAALRTGARRSAGMRSSSRRRCRVDCRETNYSCV